MSPGAGSGRPGQKMAAAEQSRESSCIGLLPPVRRTRPSHPHDELNERRNDYDPQPTDESMRAEEDQQDDRDRAHSAPDEKCGGDRVSHALPAAGRPHRGRCVFPLAVFVGAPAPMPTPSCPYVTAGPQLSPALNTWQTNLTPEKCDRSRRCCDATCSADRKWQQRARARRLSGGPWLVRRPGRRRPTPSATAWKRPVVDRIVRQAC